MDEKAYELKNKVQEWVDRNFNFIQLDVVEAYFRENGAELFEYIESEYFDLYECNEWLNSLDDDEYKEIVEEVGEDLITEVLNDQYNTEMTEYFGNENYPLWNTLFEVRGLGSSLICDKAKEIGLGVIREFESLRDILFMTSGGHSFLSDYWIPLYLSLYEDEWEVYKNVDYSML